jgi:signal transduction histidine kinase
LRPLAILYAILFRALREVLAVLVWIGLWAFWLISQLFAWALVPPIWLLRAYTRLRYGRAAAEELRAVETQAEADGQAWRQRANARLARRIGWPSDSDTFTETPPAGSEDRPLTSRFE